MYITVEDLERSLFELISMGVNDDCVLCFSSGGDNYVNSIVFTDGNGNYLGGVSVGKTTAGLN